MVLVRGSVVRMSATVSDTNVGNHLSRKKLEGKFQIWPVAAKALQEDIYLRWRIFVCCGFRVRESGVGQISRRWNCEPLDFSNKQAS